MAKHNLLWAIINTMFSAKHKAELQANFTEILGKPSGWMEYMDCKNWHEYVMKWDLVMLPVLPHYQLEFSLFHHYFIEIILLMTYDASNNENRPRHLAVAMHGCCACLWAVASDMHDRDLFEGGMSLYLHHITAHLGFHYLKDDIQMQSCQIWEKQFGSFKRVARNFSNRRDYEKETLIRMHFEQLLDIEFPGRQRNNANVKKATGEARDLSPLADIVLPAGLGIRKLEDMKLYVQKAGLKESEVTFDVNGRIIFHVTGHSSVRYMRIVEKWGVGDGVWPSNGPLPTDPPVYHTIDIPSQRELMVIRYKGDSGLRELEGLTVPMLKRICKEFGCKVGGLKGELVKRVHGALVAKFPALELSDPLLAFMEKESDGSSVARCAEEIKDHLSVASSSMVHIPIEVDVHSTPSHPLLRHTTRELEACRLINETKSKCYLVNFSLNCEVASAMENPAEIRADDLRDEVRCAVGENHHSWLLPITMHLPGALWRACRHITERGWQSAVIHEIDIYKVPEPIVNVANRSSGEANGLHDGADGELVLSSSMLLSQLLVCRVPPEASTGKKVRASVLLRYMSFVSVSLLGSITITFSVISLMSCIQS